MTWNDTELAFDRLVAEGEALSSAYLAARATGAPLPADWAQRMKAVNDRLEQLADAREPWARDPDSWRAGA